MFVASVGALSVLGLGCNSGSSSSNPSDNPIFSVGLTNGPTLPVVTGNNVLTMTVNGSTCAAGSYVNKPCVSVTVCTPGTATCTTVSDILVDTGSFGLRVFKSALGGLSLNQVTTGGASVAACVHFGDGSTDWGPVQMADVVLGGESAVTVPIQVIDSTFFSGHYSCGTPDATPSAAGFNGILGVGLFEQDCGNNCVNNANNGIYFACSGTTCGGSRVPLASQVSNPVASLPVDNNGVLLRLPSVGINGTLSSSGYLILGIGTESNNTPSNTHTYGADSSTGDFTATYSGQTYSSFLDSGSNGLFFPGTLTSCGGGTSGWFCPSSITTLSATNNSSSSSVSGNVAFQVANTNDILGTGNSVFPDLGGSSGGGLGSSFDWGLPFYLGRNVYVGLENKSSSVGSGTYWAY